MMPRDAMGRTHEGEGLHRDDEAASKTTLAQLRRIRSPRDAMAMPQCVPAQGGSK